MKSICFIHPARARKGRHHGIPGSFQIFRIDVHTSITKIRIHDPMHGRPHGTRLYPRLATLANCVARMPPCQMMAQECASRRVANTSCRMNGMPPKSIRGAPKKVPGASSRARRRGLGGHASSSSQREKSGQSATPRCPMDVHHLHASQQVPGEKHACRARPSRRWNHCSPSCPSHMPESNGGSHHANAAGCLRGRRRFRCARCDQWSSFSISSA